MINFITPSKQNCYYNLILKFVDAIAPSASISEECVPNAVNVHFFCEVNMQAKSKMQSTKGINVFIAHGLADKGYTSSKNVANYDYVVVPGPFFYDKLMNQGFDTSKILVSGYAKIDNLFKQLRNPKKTVWLPTHNCSLHIKDTLSSYPALQRTLAKLRNIEISTHPANNEKHAFTDNILLQAKVVVADSGSSIYEAMALGIPVVFPDWLVKKNILKWHGKTLEAEVYRRNIGYHARSAKELPNVIVRAQRSGMSKNDVGFMENVFPSALRGKSGLAILKNLQRLEKLL